MPQLDPSHFPTQLFWLAVSFLALFLLMQFVIVPMCQRVFAQRGQVTEGMVETAQKMRDEAQMLRAQYESAMLKAQQEAKALVTAAEQAMQAEQARAMDHLNRDFAEKLNTAEQALNKAKDEALASAQKTLPDLVSATVMQLVGAKPNAQDLNQAIGQTTLKEVA